MADYHVGAGEITGEIYAGVLTKNGKSWRNRSIVTDAAICAVRDHLINQMEQSKQIGLAMSGHGKTVRRSY